MSKVLTLAKIGNVEVYYRDCRQKAAELQEGIGTRSWNASELTFSLCVCTLVSFIVPTDLFVHSLANQRTALRSVQKTGICQLAMWYLSLGQLG